MMDRYDYGYAVMQVTLIISEWEFDTGEDMYAIIKHILEEHEKIDNGTTSWLDNICGFIEDNRITFETYKKSEDA
jgi:hypothetical protein